MASPASEGLRSGKLYRRADDVLLTQRSGRAVIIHVQRRKSPASDSGQRPSSATPPTSSIASPTAELPSVPNEATSTIHHELKESIIKPAAKRIEPGHDGEDTCETKDDGKVPTKPKRAAESGSTGPRKRGKRSQDLTPELGSEVHADAVSREDVMKFMDLVDKEQGKSGSASAGTISEEGDEHGIIPQTPDGEQEISIANEPEHLAEDGQDELAAIASVGNAAKEDGGPGSITQTSDGEHEIPNVNASKEVDGERAEFERTTASIEADTPTPGSRHKEVCEPAAVLFTVEWDAQRNRRNVITPLKVAKTGETAPWEDLKSTSTVEYKGDTYRRGDDVVLCVGDSTPYSEAPARIHEIRKLGDGRTVISVLWYFSKKEAKRYGGKLSSWPKGQTHMLSNWLEVTMWDTLNGKVEQGEETVLSHNHVLDLCHRVGSIHRVNDLSSILAVN